jgi:ADP-heptose:LPS heptosyltransferase
VAVSPILLAVRALGLGDLLAAVPALRGLRRGFPEHRIVLAAPDGLGPLAMLTGAVDEVLETRPLETPALNAPDIAANLHGSGPESHRAILRTRPHRLLAFEHPEVPESAGMPAWDPHEHEVERWCRLLAAFGLFADPDDLDLAPPPVAAPVGTGAAFIVHPGAAQPSRRWPVDRWAAVVRGLRAAGRRVIITGSSEERPLALEVARLAGVPEISVLAGRTDVLQLAAAISAADTLVAGDTGVGHLATALGTPSVLLFGPTPPAHWGPPPGRRLHRVLWAGEPSDAFASEPAPGLLRLTADQVLEALEVPPALDSPQPGHWRPSTAPS